MKQVNATQIQHAYDELLSLIVRRQDFEQKNPVPPYSTHQTDINFFDHENYTLLQYAAALGDMAKVKNCLDKGAKIDYTSHWEIEKPIEQALGNGHVEIADFLYQQGADCSTVNISECGDEKTKAWLKKAMEQALYESFPEPAKITAITKENQFFRANLLLEEGERVDVDNTLEQKRSSKLEKLALGRATEIGDIDFIRKYLANKNVDEIQDVLDHILIEASKNGFIDIVELAVKNGARINHGKMYYDCALHAAITNQHAEIIEYLLNNGANINQQDSNKRTPVMLAVKSGNSLVTHNLMKHNPDLSKIDINGDNIFHYCARSSDAEFTQALLGNQKILDLANKGNIYDQKPADAAMAEKNDKMILLFNPDKSMQDLRSSEKYGNNKSMIRQRGLIKKFIYYLQYMYRDISNLSPGYCNGLSYLYSYYSSKGKTQYFFDSLRMMIEWKGTDIELLKTFPEKQKSPHYLYAKQAEHYKNLGELFEQWINDAVFFQNSTLRDQRILDIRPDQRAQQMQLMTGEAQQQHVSLYCDYRRYPVNRNVEQAREMLKYLLRMPSDVRFEIAGGLHIISGFKNRDGQYALYDSNVFYETIPCETIDELLERILDFKYIFSHQLQNDTDLFEFPIYVFCFRKDLQKMDLANFYALAEEEIPKSKSESQAFQDKSPNKFTPLHVAVMTRSLPLIRKLLDDNLCDLDAKDAMNRTALEICYQNDYADGAVLILSSKLMDYSDLKRSYQLLFDSIHNSRVECVEVISKMMRLNPDLTHAESLPLIKAILSENDSITQFFLKQGANPLKAVENAEETPLLVSISCESTACSKIFASLSDVNMLDELGNSALHYVIAFNKIRLLNQLLNFSIDLLITNSKNQTIFDIMEERNDFNKHKIDLESRILLLQTLLPHMKFDLSLELHKRYIFNILLTCLESKVSNLFEKVLDLCDKDILAMKTEDGLTILHMAFIEKDFIKMIKLLNHGVDVNVLPPILPVLISKPDFPEKYQIIELFLKCGADLNIKYGKMQTAQSLIEGSHDDKLKSLLESHERNMKPGLKS